MQKQDGYPLMVLYRMKNQSDNIYPNAFITKRCKQFPPKVKQIKKVFPWAQLQTKQQQNYDQIKWVMRFGLTMNKMLDCSIWLDLPDQQTVPMVGNNKIFVQLQKSS